MRSFHAKTHGFSKNDGVTLLFAFRSHLSKQIFFVFVPHVLNKNVLESGRSTVSRSSVADLWHTCGSNFWTAILEDTS